MKTVDLIIESSTNFYTQLKQDNNGRYRSWEYCYKHFNDARNNSNADIDYLSLHLAFYLASWGMYRGSSFLLQKDYKIHIPIIQEMLKKKYDDLFGIECVKLREKANQKLLLELNEKLENYYNDVRLSIVEFEPKNRLSSTLITKILMGVFGCVPAYDRYFISGVKSQGVSTGNYNINSILKLVDFYETNEEILEKSRKQMNVFNLPYPQMKILDMGFWQIGFNLDNQKGIKTAH